MIANRLPRGPAMCSADWHRDHGGSDRSRRQSAARSDRCTDPQRRVPAPAATQPAPSICISALAPSTQGPRQNHNPHSAIHLAGSLNSASMRSAGTRAAASALRPRTSQNPPGSRRPRIVIQAGICDGDRLGTKSDVGRGRCLSASALKRSTPFAGILLRMAWSPREKFPSSRSLRTPSAT